MRPHPRNPSGTFADRDVGHGGQTKDLDGDEEDGYDEVIYPVDFRQVGHITDDEMHRILVKPLQPGTRLTAIFDSCHSGTALDLPYIYSTQGILKEPNLAKEAGQGLLGVIASYSQGDIGGMIKKGMGFFKKATGGEEAHNRALATKTSPADVIMLSGSKDDQTSYVSFLLSILCFSSVFWCSLLYAWLHGDQGCFHVRAGIQHEGAGTGNQGVQGFFNLFPFFLIISSFDFRESWWYTEDTAKEWVSHRQLSFNEVHQPGRASIPDGLFPA